MNDALINELLGGLRQQDYPLELSKEAADALCECIRRVMDAVPEDDQVFVRADYDLATSALCHPTAPRRGWKRGYAQGTVSGAQGSTPRDHCLSGAQRCAIVPD